MGLLERFVPQSDITIVDEAATVPNEVYEKPVPAPVLVKEVPAPVLQMKDLEIKRDPHGFIKSATGYNAAGEKVSFEFERDGKKTLKKIRVK